MVNSSQLRDAFIEAQLAGDRVRGLELMADGLASGMSVKDLHLEVIQQAQQEIGRMWVANEITVAREHAASAIAQLALAQLYPHLPRAESNGWRVVLACVEGEQHELAARIGNDFLEMAGFDVIYLGADTPADAVVEALAENHAHILALSITMSYHWPALERTIRTAQNAAPDVMLVVGGRAVEDKSDALTEMGVVCSAARADVMVERVSAEVAKRGRL